MKNIKAVIFTKLVAISLLMMILIPIGTKAQFSSLIVPFDTNGILHWHDTACNPPVTLGVIPPCGGGNTATYTVSQIPYAPYPFTGTNAFTSTYDDYYSPYINLGFTFCFFGNNYTQIIIGTNNILSFNPAYVNTWAQWSIPGTIPSSGNPTNSIMCPWQDLYPPSAASAVNCIKYQLAGTAPFRRFIASWINVPFYSCTTIHTENQCVLHESSNEIDIFIHDKPDCSGWNGGKAIEGIQNSTGTAPAFWVTGRNATQFTVTTPEGYRFCPDNPPPTISWTGPSIIGSSTGDSIVAGSSGDYIATITYSCNNMVAHDTFTVVIRDSLPTFATTPDSCGNHVGTIIAYHHGGTGPYTYAWTPTGQTGQTATGLGSGLYTCTVTDVNGCWAADTITVDSVSALSATGTIVQNVLCFGGNNGEIYITPTGVGPFAYLWSPSGATTQTISNLLAGIYTCTVINPNNLSCQAHVIDTITEPPVLVVNTTPYTVLCHGGNTGSATSSVTGGTTPYNYIWSSSGGNAATANALVSGTYVVTVTDANGCTASSTTVVPEPPVLTVSLSPSTTICIGQNTNITATPGGGTNPYGPYSWSNGGNTQTINVAPITTTSYTVTVTDANGCTVVSPSVTITVNPPLAVVVCPDNHICEGESTTITAAGTGGDGNYTFTWDNGVGTGAGPITISPTVTTTYAVTLTDGCGSPQSNGSVTITVYPAPSIHFSGNPLNGCSPLAVQFTDQSTSTLPIVSWKWDFGDGSAYSDSASPKHIYETAGIFSVTLTVTSAANCTSTLTDSAMVDAYPKPIARFLIDPNQTTLLQPEVNLVDQSTGAVYVTYNFGDGNSSTKRNTFHNYTDTGTFWVTQSVMNDYGCTDTITGTVIITSYYTFYIPNSFSPGNDGINDYFQPYGTGITDYEMTIFDRWGEKLFTTTDINLPWDGFVNGTIAAQGTYIYNIRIKDNNKEAHEYFGKLTLVR